MAQTIVHRGNQLIMGAVGVFLPEIDQPDFSSLYNCPDKDIMVTVHRHLPLVIKKNRRRRAFLAPHILGKATAITVLSRSLHLTDLLILISWR
ncbi:MAG: hypothetical protein WAK60_05650 [Sedimentisphaerales bacterium]